MFINYFRFIGWILLSTSLLFCDKNNNSLLYQEDYVYNIGRYDSLAKGNYQGLFSLLNYKNYANFGLGANVGLGGEMTILDNNFYLFSGSGIISNGIDNNDSACFATGCKFIAKSDFNLSAKLNFLQLISDLNTYIKDTQLIYAIKITAQFDSLVTRAPLKQHKPYQPLDSVIKYENRFYHKNISGTMVGFWFPKKYINLNVPGFHFHFISTDKTVGGHVLQLKFQQAAVQLAEYKNFSILSTY